MYDVPVLVKEALKDGRRLKNYKIQVLNDDESVDFTIDNNTLIRESVNLDERLCSGDTLKFGLCEGSSLEFQYFNHPNISQRRIRVFVEVQYKEGSLLKWQSIPLGYFQVNKCARQASTGIMKATCYNKLQSEYLDQKANERLAQIFTQDFTLTVHDIRKALLGSYQIDDDWKEVSSTVPPMGTVQNEWIKVSACHFTSLTGYSGPINAYTLGVSSLPTPIYIRFANMIMPYSLTSITIPELTGIEATYGSLVGLEKNIVKYLKNLIDNTPIDTTWESMRDYICSHDGFHHIIGVNKISSGLTNHWYSTIQWEYEEEHNLAHTVDGTLADVEYRLGTGRTDLVIPSHIDFSTQDVAESGSRWFYSEGQYSYDAGGTVEHATWDACRYSDGTEFSSGQTDAERCIIVYEYDSLPPADMLTFQISKMADFTLRQITSAVFETLAQFGQLSRVTDLFSGVELNHSRTAPSDTLYPGTSLYPVGAALSTTKSMYSKLWADEGNVRKWRYLIVKYKGLDGDNKETEFTLRKTVNADGTDDYYMDDNWLFLNDIWGEHSISIYADDMILKMQDITWFPFEMWCAGLPYLETGDELEISIGETTYTSYILQRQLKGIQNLQDTYINGTLDIF